MKLDDLTPGERVFVDSNIFVYHFSGASRQCRDLLRRCHAGDVDGVISYHILLEVTHRLMILEARLEGVVRGKNAASQLLRKPDIVKKLHRYYRYALAIPSMGLNVLPLSADILALSHEARLKYGLLVNDSITVALMVANGVNCIATSDADFKRVVDIRVYSPTDVLDIG